MATLEALAISGIRGYNPQKLERIDFTHPLTLINGKNGSGKTTIIECLKYITTGVLPPSVNRENCFVMDPSIAGTPEVRGDIRLRFRTAKNRVVIAKKIFMVTKTEKKLTSRAVEQSLKTKDQQGKQIQVSQRCADIEKQIPQMLGISKPILNNIVFCHQDDSLWPFSENNVLKNIFDQLFDTKRFTKTLDNMKDALKEFQKEKIQLKGQLEFLKNSYFRISQNHNQVLLGLVQVVQTSEQLYKVQQELAPLNQKLAQKSSTETQKHECISKKSVLEYKITEMGQKMRGLGSKLEAMGMKVEEVDEEEGKKRLEAMNQDIQSREAQIRVMEKLLEDTKDKEAVDKKKSQLYMEIKRIREIMPELKKESSSGSAQHIIEAIKEKLKKMKANEKLLKQSRQKYNRIQLQALPSPSQIERQKQQGKALQTKLQKTKLQLQSLQTQIHSLYSTLYTPNLPQPPKITQQTKQSITRIPKLQAQLQLKKSQLQAYKKLRPSPKTHQQELFQLHYTGIELQQIMLEYMQSHKECGICSRPITDQEIERVRQKMQRTIRRSEARIQELKRNRDPRGEVDPGPIIVEIQEFIAGGVRMLKGLEEEKERYDSWLACERQGEINRELNKLMASIELKPSLSKSKNENRQANSQPQTLQHFKNLCNEHRILQIHSKTLSTSLIHHNEKLLSYSQQTQQHKLQASEKQKLSSQITLLQTSIKDINIVENVLGKIEELYEGVRREDRAGDSEESSGEIGGRLAGLDRGLEQVKRDRVGLQVNLEYSKMSRQREGLRKELAVVDDRLAQLNSLKDYNSQLQQKRNSLQTKQAKLSQSLSIKKSLHANPLTQPITPYLQKLLRHSNLSSLHSDITSTLKAMERATNRLHNQKMDQINKILFDLWQEVYHARDIEWIRIDSAVERKGMGYGYSIVMRKNGQVLEMKGRCSMGQKVLASLIIRMALAQAFSASTHILTLDQPTTNLDRQHIENLAQSISTILQMQHNSRLQLIVISHDMEFISLLKKHTSCFYQVYRNQKGFSGIRRRDIGELGGEGKVGGLEAVHY